jgi:hypothetical protein
MKMIQRAAVWVVTGLVVSSAVYAMSAKVGRAEELVCPKERQARLERYEYAYKHLLALSSRGEKGKVSGSREENAAKAYRFYRECLKSAGDILSDTQKDVPKPLLSCRLTPGTPIVIDMKVREEKAYESLRRVEISVRDESGNIYFRAMNNRASHPDPVPPNAFGVYLRDKKSGGWSVKSAGHEAQTLVQTAYGYLTNGCRTRWEKGVLEIHWEIVLEKEKMDGKNVDLYTRIISDETTTAPWLRCRHDGIQKQGYTEIQPLFFIRSSREKIDRSLLSNITLVTLKQAASKGLVRIYGTDDTESYSYEEVSRKIIDLAQKRVVRLKPGFYRLIYNDIQGDPPAGFYGKSDLFEVKDEEKITVSVWMEPAI